MGVVHAEDAHAPPDPGQHHPAQRLPEAPPVGAVEVDVVDVLVALGRVLGVLQGAVRAAVEPLRVLGQPGVVRRALDREVQGDLHVVPARRLDQALEVRQRPQLRVDRLVPALAAADGPGAAGLAAAGGGRVVATLAVGAADRVDRRQVDHVEAQLREPRQLQPHPREAAERAREELVPRPHAGPLAVHVHLERLRARPVAALRVARQGLRHLRRQGRVGAGRRRVAVRQGRAGRLGHPPVGALQAPGRVPQQRRALGELALEVLLPGGQLALDLVAPRREPVHPRLDLEAVDPERARRELAPPAVRRELQHRLLGEAARPGRPVPHRGPQGLVAVADEVALHHHGVADRALGGPAAPLDGGLDVVDLDPGRGRARRRCWHGRHSA